MISDISIKKHLGQYFSGKAVATLLAHLADFQSAKSIVDPMSGTGDMIEACEPSKNPNKHYYGVEIDDNVLLHSVEKFRSTDNVKLLHGNAFKLNTIKELASRQYDLVITNPPYVRYQTIAGNKINSSESLDTVEIKRNLISSLASFKHLDVTDRELLEILISSYSGFSDLAVPSWFLCSLLTKIEGRIAMVVPQTWLNRDYANVIHYLLLRWFQIEHIIEDANSVWFPNAQVKTTLIVAKRVKRKNSISEWNKENFTYCAIYSSSMNGNSLVGKIFPQASQPEKLFVKQINKGEQSSVQFSTSKISLAEFSKDLELKAVGKKWYNFAERCNTDIALRGNSLKVPSKLKSWLENKTTQFQTLDDTGVSVSQGLRTGANDFFYMDILEHRRNGIIGKPKMQFKQSNILVPSQFYREVIRKQSELNGAYSTTDFSPKGIVLSLQHGICREDAASNEHVGRTFKRSYQLFPSDLNNHIEEFSKTNLGTTDKPRFIYELSAVAPNIRRPSEGRPARFWYMLPTFTQRHFPDLFVPRVNGQHPITRLNTENRFIIDANFSTLWVKPTEKRHNKYSILSILNSSWCIVAMEEYGTVMGGGALKLEATQIKKLPIPIFDGNSIKKLTQLGKRLVQKKSNKIQILRQVDQIVLHALNFTSNIEKKLEDLNQIKIELFRKRTIKKRSIDESL